MNTNQAAQSSLPCDEIYNKIKALHNSHTQYILPFYTHDNWFQFTKHPHNTLEAFKENIPNDPYEILMKYRCAIWMNTNGEILFRLSPYLHPIKAKSYHSASVVLSNYTGHSIHIMNATAKSPKNAKNMAIIYTNHLALIEEDTLHFINSYSEFYRNPYNRICRRQYMPSTYLTKEFNKRFLLPEKSLILNLLYSYANKNRNRFLFFLNYIASIFNNFLVGKKLIFIHQDTISRGFLSDIISILINSIVDKTNLPFNGTDKKDFKNHQISISSHITTVYDIDQIPNFEFEDISTHIFMVNNEFIQDFHTLRGTFDTNNIYYYASDIENFACILRYYTSQNFTLTLDCQDDKEELIKLRETDVKKFSNAIKDKNIDFFKNSSLEEKEIQNLKEDFEKNRIKQSNLIKYFNTIFPNNQYESSRKLMVDLKAEDGFFFSTNNITPSNKQKFYSIKNNPKYTQS